MCKPWLKVLPRPAPAMAALTACIGLLTACAPPADDGSADAVGPAVESAATASRNGNPPGKEAPEYSSFADESAPNLLDSANVPESSEVADNAITANESARGKTVESARPVGSSAQNAVRENDGDANQIGSVAVSTPVALAGNESSAAGNGGGPIDQSASTSGVSSHDDAVVEDVPVASEAAPQDTLGATGPEDTVTAAQQVGPSAALVSAEALTVDTGPASLPLVDPCTQYDAEYDTWMDRSQIKIYRTVCGATAWFDGFFGDRRYDQVTGETFGRISAGGYWDQRNGFDPRVRFRARFALPSLRDRGSLLIGRGDEQDVIEERNTSRDDQNPVAPSPNQDENVSTFVGFGWDQLASLTRGLSLSAGVRLSTPIEPIIKIKYRRNWQLTERNLLSIRPLAYWRSQEGLGATVQLDVDHVINSAFLFRWANYGNVSQDEEVEGVNWGTTFFLFQALSEKQALTYSVFARGETNAPITFQNTGFEFRYRQRILRKWLFIEYNGGVSWPRYLPEETRKANFGSGLRLEAYFGPAPDHWMR